MIRTQALLLSFSRLSEYIAYGRLSKAFGEWRGWNCMPCHCEQVCWLPWGNGGYFVRKDRAAAKTWKMDFLGWLLGREVPDEENGAWANAERLEGLERYANLRSAGPWYTPRDSRSWEGLGKSIEGLGCIHGNFLWKDYAISYSSDQLKLMVYHVFFHLDQRQNDLQLSNAALKCKCANRVAKPKQLEIN